MANYYTFTKSNWFRVNNEFTLKNILNKLVVIGDGDNTLIHNKYPCKENGYFYHQLLCYGDIVGPYNEETGDYEDIEEVFYRPLQKLLPENTDVFALKYVGQEKLRFINAGYTIVTKEDIVYGNIDRLIEADVKDLTGLSNIDIDFNYRDSETEMLKEEI